MSKKFGANLQAVRKGLGLSRGRMAAMIGVSEDTLKNYETARTTPSPMGQEKLLTFIGSIPTEAENAKS